MENLYGFKAQDAVTLIEFLKDKKGESLSSLFERYAQYSGKAKGTVRNLYYTLSKLSLKNKAFCDKYLGGKPLTVEEKVEFLPCEERAMLKQILKKKGEGISVRRAVKELAQGDEKLALRFQNKYRSLIKDKKALVDEVIKELQRENKNFFVTISREKKVDATTFVSPFQVGRLKREINSLFDRTFIDLKKKNATLVKEKEKLEKENAELKRLLLSNGITNSIEMYFSKGNEKGMNI